MLTLKHIGAAVIASAIATVLVIDSADARRGGGGGGMRAGGGFGGGGMRAGGFGGGAAMRAGGINRGGTLAGNRVANARSFARASNPNRPDWGLPGRPGNRPGWGGGWGGDNWPGYGWGAAAVGAGLAYTAAADADYCDPYYASNGNCNYGYGSYAPAYGANGAAYGTDAIADCARRFRSYDPASQTYLSYGGQRVSCP
jgi:BA14K-like protein